MSRARLAVLVLLLALVALACGSNPPLACGSETCTGNERCIQGGPGKDAGSWCGPSKPFCGELSPDGFSWIPVNSTSLACIAAKQDGSRYGGCVCS